MKRFFLDTNFIVALELARDQNHVEAVKIWNDLIRTSFHLVTTSYVFDEAVTFLNSRNHFKKAIEVGENLLLSPHVTLVHVDETLFFDGWQLLQMHDDKRFSLTDCISFLVMRAENIRTALSFDGDFEQAGFLANQIEQ